MEGERERRWLIEYRSWGKKKGNVVWVGRDRLLINGELWCPDEDPHPYSFRPKSVWPRVSHA